MIISKIIGLLTTILALFKAVVAIVLGVARTVDERIDALVPIGTLSGKLMAVVIGLVLPAILGTTITLVGIASENSTLIEFGSVMTLFAGVSSLTVGILFLIVWPLDQRGVIENVIVKSGIRQWNRVSTGLAALFVGTTVGGGVSLLVGFLALGFSGQPLATGEVNQRLVGGTFLLVTVLASAGSMVLFQRRNQSYVRTDLTIIDVKNYDEKPRELVVRNDSTETIQLWKAKIEDSNGDRYRLNINSQLRPGELGTFELPAEFSLRVKQYELPLGLDLFYDDMRAVSIYARNGETYVLEWDESEDVADPDDIPQKVS